MNIDDTIIITLSKTPKKNVNRLIRSATERIYNPLKKDKRKLGSVVVCAVDYGNGSKQWGHIMNSEPKTYDNYLNAYLEKEGLNFSKIITDSAITYQPNLNHPIGYRVFTIQSRLIIPIIVSVGKTISAYAIFILSSRPNIFDEKLRKSAKHLIRSILNVSGQQQGVINKAISRLNERAYDGEPIILKLVREDMKEIVSRIRPGRMMCYVGLLEYDRIQINDEFVTTKRIIFPKNINDDIFDNQDQIMFDGEQHAILLFPRRDNDTIGVIGRTIEGLSEDGKVFPIQNIGDVSKDPDFIRLPQRGFNTRSQLCVPLKINNQILGAISIEHEEKNAFDRDTERAIETLAIAAFVALQTSRLYSTIKYLTTFETAQDEQSLFQGVLEECRRLIVAEFGCIGIVDERGGIHYNITFGVQELVIAPPAISYSTYLLHKKLPELYIPNLKDKHNPDIQRMEDHGYHYRENNPLAVSELFVPIVVGADKTRTDGTFIAIINLQSREVDGFSPNAIKLVIAFAQQVAYLIRNMRFASNLQKLNEFAKKK
jgi:GAF domain-containing protein